MYVTYFYTINTLILLHSSTPGAEKGPQKVSIHLLHFARRATFFFVFFLTFFFCLFFLFFFTFFYVFFIFYLVTKMSDHALGVEV